MSNRRIGDLGGGFRNLGDLSSEEQAAQLHKLAVDVPQRGPGSDYGRDAGIPAAPKERLEYEILMSDANVPPERVLESANKEDFSGLTGQEKRDKLDTFQSLYESRGFLSRLAEMFFGTSQAKRDLESIRSKMYPRPTV